MPKTDYIIWVVTIPMITISNPPYIHYRFVISFTIYHQSIWAHLFSILQQQPTTSRYKPLLSDRSIRTLCPSFSDSFLQKKLFSFFADSPSMGNCFSKRNKANEHFPRLPGNKDCQKKNLKSLLTSLGLMKIRKMKSGNLRRNLKKNLKILLTLKS